jgi:predicted CoA-binding protein
MTEYLKSGGYRIILVNPQEADLLSERRCARLEVIPEGVDIVDTFAALDSPRS